MRDSPPVTWEAPHEFEEYRLIRQLGAGTMGVVFLAHDTLLDRPVAIKFIGALEVDATTRQRFFTEARAVARLSHPNVVAVYRVGELRQRPYLVSEYARGTSLAAIAKPIPWQRALKIGLGLARGLAAAHRSGVLHRDIKPANIMLGDGDEPKLLDFGLAKVVNATASHPRATETASILDRATGSPSRDNQLDATLSMAGSLEARRPGDGQLPALAPGSHLTKEGAIIGTPLYLAPELWRGEPASPASDVYALGVVLYELLAGHPPHAGRMALELAARVTAEDAVPIASRVANLPPQLAQLIDACASRDLARRPCSGDAVHALLEAVAARAPGFDARQDRNASMLEPAQRAGFEDAGSEARDPRADPSGMSGEHKLVAVLYADLRGFATLTETGHAADIAQRLNQYFDRMVEAITSHGGTIDKFIGDAVLAVFGGLIPLVNPAASALDAAIAMRASLRQLNQQRIEDGLGPLDNGIGICFGDVLFAAIGSARRRELTILGDVVNTATLLEAVTKTLGSPIVMSEGLAAALPPERRAALTSLGEVKLKGKPKPMMVFGSSGRVGVAVS
jgi:serine/threonine protein kinase